MTKSKCLENVRLATWYFKRKRSKGSYARANEIEVSDLRPKWVPLDVTEASSGIDINVEGLYWGIYHLLRKLVKDQRQMEEAEKNFQHSSAKRIIKQKFTLHS